MIEIAVIIIMIFLLIFIFSLIYDYSKSYNIKTSKPKYIEDFIDNNKIQYLMTATSTIDNKLKEMSINCKISEGEVIAKSINLFYEASKSDVDEVIFIKDGQQQKVLIK